MGRKKEKQMIQNLIEMICVKRVTKGCVKPVTSDLNPNSFTVEYDPVYGNFCCSNCAVHFIQ